MQQTITIFMSIIRKLKHVPTVALQCKTQPWCQNARSDLIKLLLQQLCTLICQQISFLLFANSYLFPQITQFFLALRYPSCIHPSYFRLLQLSKDLTCNSIINMSSRRLKDFCELCRKQCKDQNGFKCHINSQSHQMRVREFASNPLEHIEKSSRQFQGRFIQMLKTKYPGEPKYLEELHNELIEQKKFLKFNHTQWKNLTQFGLHLQTVKNLQVIGTPPNCKVVYVVHKTKDFIEQSKKEKLLADRQRQKEQLEKTIAARIEKEREFAAQQQSLLNARLSQLQKESLTMAIPDKLEFNIDGFNTEVKRSAFYTTEELEQQTKKQEGFYKKKMDKIEKLYEQLKKKADYSDEEEQIEWIKEGITIKIKPHEDIDPVFHNKKCKITKIVQPYVAQVHLGTASIEIDQSNIETVIPKLGNKVMILYGDHRGQIGILKQAHLQQGYGVIAIDQKIVKMPFNLFSRWDQQ